MTKLDLQKFNSALPRYIAGGAPSEDTLLHYNNEIDNFLSWCYLNSYDPYTDINEAKAFEYLEYLYLQNYSLSSVNLKICAARTFYHVAKKVLMIQNMDNPFADVHPKKPSYDDTEFDFFTTEELKEICDSILKRTDTAATRDLAIVMLMAVEGLRTVEIHRMNEEDINFDKGSIFIRGKGKNSYIYPCDDTMKILSKYIDEKPISNSGLKYCDNDGTPVFIGMSKKFFGARISRNGIRWSINHILAAVGKKKKGESCHTLRHSCGTNLYKETKDLRLVQETLRHSSPTTTARYTHLNKEDRKTSILSPFAGTDQK